MQAELLRLVTCGSVDDGKSTLIGRLLYDTKQILADQLEHIEETSRAPRRRLRQPRAAHRRPPRRARAGDHDRRRLPLVRDRAAPLPARRRARARPVHAQHGHRRLDGRPRRDPARRATRRASSRRAATRTSRRCSASRTSRSPSTRWTSSTSRRSASARSRPSCGRSPSRLGIARPARDPDVGAPRRQRRRAARDAMPWYDGPTLLEHLETVELAGDRNLDRPPLPGAVGDPADGRRPPRLPRLRGPGRERDVARRRRGRRAALGPALARRARRDGRRRARRGGAADVRRRSGSRTTSTSAAATCSPTRTLPPVVARELDRADLLDERAPARAARQARRQAHDAARCARDRRRAPLGGRHAHARRGRPRPSGSS